MNLPTRGLLTTILLLPMLLCCSAPESESVDVKTNALTASDLLHLARLADKDKVTYLKSKDWKVLESASMKSDSDGGDQFVFFKKNEEEWNVYQTWDRSLYVRLKKDFENLGYDFQMQGSTRTQYLNYGWDGQYFLGIAIMQTGEGYFVMISRSKVKSDRSKFVTSNELLETSDDEPTEVEDYEDEELPEVVYDEEEVIESDSLPVAKMPFGGKDFGGSSGSGQGTGAGVNARKRK